LVAIRLERTSGAPKTRGGKERKQVREANVCYREKRADECEAIETFLADSLA
jgi:hypothetical protein